MKKITLTGLAALGLVEISAATPAAAQNAQAFQGAYAGAHTGRYSADATFTSAPYAITNPCCGTGTAPGRVDNFDFDGAIAGAHGGFNFVVAPNVIAGVEADWTNLGDGDASTSGSGNILTADGFSFQYRSRIDLEWQSTIRGRLGFVAGNALFFATAGVAFLNVDWSEVANNTAPFGPNFTFNHSASETLVGGVVGAGVEYALAPSIIVGTDYLYENFEDFGSVPHGARNGQTGTLDDFEVHKVRVRVSFRFGAPAP